MSILDIGVPLIAAVNGPVRLHSEYILLADIVLATPSTAFQHKPHFEFGIVPGDGVNLLWPEVIGSIRGRYFIPTRQELDAETAKEWSAVSEIVPADQLLARAREIVKRLAKLPPLASSYTRIALTPEAAAHHRWGRRLREFPPLTSRAPRPAEKETEAQNRLNLTPLTQGGIST